MKKGKLFRQGDVLLRKVSKMPKTAKRSEDPVLALGETSGHGHVIKDAEVYRSTRTAYVSVEEHQQAEAALEHLLVETGVWTREHKKIPLPEGIYAVVQQREFNPYTRKNTYVVD